MIHRYWTGDRRPPAEPWLGAVVAHLHPGDTVRNWVDATLPVALLDLLDGDPLADNPTHRSNVVRWWLLDIYGGTWLDHDLIPLRPLPAGAWTATIGFQRTGCALRFPLGHTLPATMLTAVGATHYTADSDPVDVAGDRKLQHVAAGWRGLDSHQLPFDAAGRAVVGAEPWAVHLWSSSARHHLMRRP